MKQFKLLLLLAISLPGCRYLDVVPDNIATIDYAFRSRVAAERYLFTCYSYLPSHADVLANPGFLAGDEIWIYGPPDWDQGVTRIARGNQNKVGPYLDSWGGISSGVPIFRALRDCNIFLDNIDVVPDLDNYMKDRWIGEVKFLKAYYHFYLLRHYGPIPLIKVNTPITASAEEAKVKRMPVDSCINYIVQLLDEAEPALPLVIDDRASELGRVTQVMVKAVKADVLATAASPLFNGNPDYASFKDHDGVQLFNPDFDIKKWEKAAEATKLAIDAAHEAGFSLFTFTPTAGTQIISDTNAIQLSIRNSVTERWNSEVIWGNSNSNAGNIQRYSFIRVLDPAAADIVATLGIMAPPMKIVEQFYTKNGVPINEDKTWDYQNRYALQVADEDDRHQIENGYTTAKLNFDREPRFYADLGFDGGIWLGQGKYDDTKELWTAKMKVDQPGGRKGQTGYPVTGYITKKLNKWTNAPTTSSYAFESYPWPVMRLAELYLLYAECANEAYGPGGDELVYVNKVRERAGLPSVQDSWTNFSTNPTKFATQVGLRSIIQQERLIELAFEGKRFYDMKRWKRALESFNQPIEGWSIDQREAPLYYQKRLVYAPVFLNRDYFWPIREQDIIINRNIVQNPGW